ncbi:Enoyl-CoA hydratase/isomerase [Trypanosoma melophagium]|uniref:Enoyl-CoA hydratase/isomerase n=1 Tax=Trypanosoma melophagium TaxID=715481 RepID=UPI003519FA3B|nr:Enoyl-CoA hydratase/isomerase [Trypanosoma melophagium]
MLRRRLLYGGPPLFITITNSTTTTNNNNNTTKTAHPIVCLTSQRGIKTLDVREYRPLATPIEFRFYQRYANHPNRQSGIQFLTHYNTHQRFRVRKDFIDYMHWGKEQGQARLPHRHQRVAFDFHDNLHPTRTNDDNSSVHGNSKSWFTEQDPSLKSHPDLDSTFDPNRREFSHPEHWNKMFSKRRPGEGSIDLAVLPSPSLLGPLMRHSDTKDEGYFKVDNRGHSDGKIPGVNTPFLGEFDQKMMQAMSRPLNADRTITGNDGRFSKTIMINEPKTHQALSAKTASELATEIDKATNGVYSKLTVLEAAQSGLTNYFCGGLNYEMLGFDLQMATILRNQARAILDKSSEVSTTTTNTTTTSVSSSSPSTSSLTKSQEREVQMLLRDAARYEDRVDDALRQHASLIWRVYSAPRPLMTLTNGKCRGTGCGVSLYAKYCALKDSTEFIFDGPNLGITPYGGLTRLLARTETSLKYPGLAEFIMLTGTSLFAGDALRLGWTDLFTTIPDMSYYIKEWFDNTEHMHNDAIAWQLGHLLDTCFKMREAHSSAMERAALSPIRARWVEDAFADQPSVKDIMHTLSEIERLPLTAEHNTWDYSKCTPYTLEDVASGLRKLEEHRLRYTLSPWDITPPEDEVALQHASEVFNAYVLERHGSVDVVVHRDAEKLAKWNRQRQKEYHAYRSLQEAPHPRHVYARLEGCEGKIVSFDFTFLKEQKQSSNCSNSNSNKDKNNNNNIGGDEGFYSTKLLDSLKREVLTSLEMPTDRDIELGWYLPTLDTSPIHSDEELMEVLHADPGIEDPQSRLKYPPIYFIVKRNTLYFSEWAYAVKHQMLLQSPFALRATFELLSEVRGGGSAEHVMPLAETLAVEFKYFYRLLRRPDFYQVGVHTDKSAEQWEEIREERRRNIHKTHLPTQPLPDFENVFERDVTLDGHTFRLRPRWSPRTLQDISDNDVLRLRAPLTYDVDGTVPLHVPLQCSTADRVAFMMEDAGGAEVVRGLGERDRNTGAPLAAPLTSNAHVPTNVNFYEMARHPWGDEASSWRREGHTAGSLEHYESQYRAAVQAVYDEAGRGTHNYWPSREACDGVSGEEEDISLLQQRLFKPLEEANAGVESWARNLRRNACEGKLAYKTEIATQEEKIYDDEYYRWFIQPGHHPNPNGLISGHKKSSTTQSGMDEAELERIWRSVAAEEESTDTKEGVAGVDELDVATNQELVEEETLIADPVLSTDEDDNN